MIDTGPQAGFTHVISIVSRSGKREAEIARVDLDEIEDGLDDLVKRTANIAHDASKDPERHDDLCESILEAMLEIETIPGNNAEALSTLRDGRRVKITRFITH